MEIPTPISISHFRKEISKYYKIATNGQSVIINRSWEKAILMDFHKKIRELGFNKNYTKNFGVDEPVNEPKVELN